MALDVRNRQKSPQGSSSTAFLQQQGLPLKLPCRSKFHRAEGCIGLLRLLPPSLHRVCVCTDALRLNLGMHVRLGDVSILVRSPEGISLDVFFPCIPVAAQLLKTRTLARKRHTLRGKIKGSALNCDLLDHLPSLKSPQTQSNVHRAKQTVCGCCLFQSSLLARH